MSRKAKKATWLSLIHLSTIWPCRCAAGKNTICRAIAEFLFQMTKCCVISVRRFNVGRWENRSGPRDPLRISDGLGGGFEGPQPSSVTGPPEPSRTTDRKRLWKFVRLQQPQQHQSPFRTEQQTGLQRIRCQRPTQEPQKEPQKGQGSGLSYPSSGAGA